MSTVDRELHNKKPSLLSKEEVELLKIYMDENADKIGKSIVKLKRFTPKPEKKERNDAVYKLKDGRELKLSHSILFDKEGHVIVLGDSVGSGTYGKGKRAEFVNFEHPGEQGKTAFVKVMKKVAKRNSETFMREIRGQKKVKHFFGSAIRVDADKGYLIIPDEGDNLHELIETGKFTFDQKIDIAIMIAEDLKKRFHDKNILHRDVKLMNVAYNQETGQGKLIDLGTWIDLNKARRKAKEKGKDPRETTVKLIEGPEFRLEKIARNLFKIEGNDIDEFYIPAEENKRGNVIERLVGTDATTAPEIAKMGVDYNNVRIFGGDLDDPDHHMLYSKKSDVFALGIEFREVMSLDYQQDWKNLQHSHPHLQTKMEKLIDNMINPDPSKRFSIEQSLRELYLIRHQRNLALGKKVKPMPDLTPATSSYEQIQRKIEKQKLKRISSVKTVLPAEITSPTAIPKERIESKNESKRTVEELNKPSAGGTKTSVGSDVGKAVSPKMKMSETAASNYVQGRNIMLYQHLMKKNKSEKHKKPEGNKPIFSSK